MLARDEARLSGEGDVNGLPSELVVLELIGDQLLPRLQRLLRLFARGVDALTEGGTLLGRKAAHLLHHRGYLALFAEIFYPYLLHGLVALGIFESGFHLVENAAYPVLHYHISFHIFIFI